jgi:hypothetical protein
MVRLTNFIDVRVSYEDVSQLAPLRVRFEGPAKVNCQPFSHASETPGKRTGRCLENLPGV